MVIFVKRKNLVLYVLRTLSCDQDYSQLRLPIHLLHPCNALDSALLTCEGAVAVVVVELHWGCWMFVASAETPKQLFSSSSEHTDCVVRDLVRVVPLQSVDLSNRRVVG